MRDPDPSPPEMPRRPCLHLMVGLPGSGKTTRARALAAETGALRLTPDEWQTRLFGNDYPHPDHDRRHAAVEGLMREMTESLLRRGHDVILDFGFWSRAERDELRAWATTLGAEPRLHYEEVPLEELWRRVARRNGQSNAFGMTEAHLREWALAFEPPGPDELP